MAVRRGYPQELLTAGLRGRIARLAQAERYIAGRGGPAAIPGELRQALVRWISEGGDPPVALTDDHP